MEQAKYKNGDIVITNKRWRGQIQSEPKYSQNGTRIEYLVWFWGGDAELWIKETDIVELVSSN